HKEYGTEDIGSLDSFCQEHCHRKCQHINEYHCHDREQHCIPEGMDKFRVSKCFHIIAKTYKFCVRHCCKFTERKVDSQQERSYKPDGKRYHCREYKDRKIFLDCFLHFLFLLF